MKHRVGVITFYTESSRFFVPILAKNGLYIKKDFYSFQNFTEIIIIIINSDRDTRSIIITV